MIIPIDFVINPALIGEGITQSEMQTWDNCSELWYLRYNLMLASRGRFSWALTYGSWMHAALEEFYLTKGKRWHIDPVVKNKEFLSAKVLADFDYWAQLAEVQMSCYASRYKADFTFWKIKKVEHIVDIEWEGIRLKGMIDLLVKSLVHGGYYVVDHKTTGRLDKQTVLGWDFRLQFMFYCWLARKLWGEDFPIKGYYINAIKKPQLRKGINESIPTFLQRVQTDMMASDEKYYYRDRLILTKGSMKHFEDTILRPKLFRVRLLMDPKVKPEIKQAIIRNKNTDHCLHYGQPCEFINACKNGLKLEQHSFRKREVKHQELEEEIAV